MIIYILTLINVYSGIPNNICELYTFLILIGLLRSCTISIPLQSMLVFSSFFFFRKKLPIVVVRDVCPSVCGNNFFSQYFDI